MTHWETHWASTWHRPQNSLMWLKVRMNMTCKC